MSSDTRNAHLPPFGWYPDPTDPAKLRWWDGARWTDHTESPRPELQPALGYSTSEMTRERDYA